MAMKHTIDESWDFLHRPSVEGVPGSVEIYGVRWADGFERLFVDMPEQQTLAYIKRSDVKDPMGFTKGKANN